MWLGVWKENIPNKPYEGGRNPLNLPTWHLLYLWVDSYPNPGVETWSPLWKPHTEKSSPSPFQILTTMFISAIGAAAFTSDFQNPYNLLTTPAVESMKPLVKTPQKCLLFRRYMLLSIIENKSSELCLNRTSLLTKSRPSNRVVAIRKWPSDTASTLSLHRLSLSSAITHVTSMDATESVCVYSMRTKANTVIISSIHNYYKMITVP